MNTREVDSALHLYRDPDLLRAIMTAAKVPVSMERVAISLDDPQLGPFVVVTRDGYFVTCLARGMQATNLHIVTRGQLDTFAEKFETVRERFALSQQLAGNRKSPFLHLVRRLLDHADCLSREEFLAVSVWEPLVPHLYFDLYFESVGELLALARELTQIGRFKGKQGESLLRMYWNMVHATSHLLLLGAAGDNGKYFCAVTEGHPGMRRSLGWTLTQTSTMPFIVRGAWAVGRLGKRILSDYKQALGEHGDFYSFLDAVFATIAIGRRHSGLRAEIVKALHAAPTTARNAQAEQVRQRMSREVSLICELASKLVECDSDELETSLVSEGRALVGTRADGLPEETLADIVRVAPLHAYEDGLSDGGKLFRTALLVAASARLAPERFYFPRAVAAEWRMNWEPKHSIALLKLHKLWHPRPTPARRQEAPGRNQACPCGSGKKYKRCCSTTREN